MMCVKEGIFPSEAHAANSCATAWLRSTALMPPSFTTSHTLLSPKVAYTVVTLRLWEKQPSAATSQAGHVFSKMHKLERPAWSSNEYPSGSASGCGCGSSLARSRNPIPKSRDKSCTSLYVTHLVSPNTFTRGALEPPGPCLCDKSSRDPRQGQPPKRSNACATRSCKVPRPASGAARREFPAASVEGCTRTETSSVCIRHTCVGEGAERRPWKRSRV
mmetsp:Transcript_51705/g.96264  ORF Transcript_51705/g.96264 Transcript_51705/m.96264 type:complete len:218 (-) Transcript_51705:122-775(-)